MSGTIANVDTAHLGGPNRWNYGFGDNGEIGLFLGDLLIANMTLRQARDFVSGFGAFVEDVAAGKIASPSGVTMTQFQGGVDKAERGTT